MSSRKRLTIHDYNSRLPGNLSFIKLNDSRTPSPLRCSLCKHEHPDWNMYSKSASPSAKCPNCKNVGITNKHEVSNNRLPEHLEYINYINTNTPTIYVCKLCKYEGSVVPKDVKDSFSCKNCRGTGMNKIDRLNSKMENFKFIEYQSHSVKATLQCCSCSYSWQIVPKNISEHTKCKMCIRAIDEKEFSEFLKENCITTDVKPKTNTSKHHFTCDLCKSKIEASMQKIKNGCVCKHCSLSDNKINESKRCRFYAINNGINFQLDIQEDGRKHVLNWYCKNGHVFNGTLAQIKNKIRAMGRDKRDNWCDRCSNPDKNRPQTIAEKYSGRWNMTIGGYTKDSYHYQFICKNDHGFNKTIDDIITTNIFCDVCEKENNDTKWNFDTNYEIKKEIDPNISVAIDNLNLSSYPGVIEDKRLDREAEKQYQQALKGDKMLYEREKRHIGKIEYEEEYEDEDEDEEERLDRLEEDNYQN